MNALLLASVLWLTPSDGQEPPPDPIFEQRYNIITVAERAILLDRSTGHTWMLRPAQTRGSDPVWVPLQRLGDDQAKVRQALEQDLKIQLTQLQRQYGPNHPVVINIKTRLARIRATANLNSDR